MPNQEDAIATLQARLNSYRELLGEANERAAAFRADAMVLDAKNKALQAEIDKRGETAVGAQAT